MKRRPLGYVPVVYWYRIKGVFFFSNFSTTRIARVGKLANSSANRRTAKRVRTYVIITNVHVRVRMTTRNVFRPPGTRVLLRIDLVLFVTGCVYGYERLVECRACACRVSTHLLIQTNRFRYRFGMD